MISPKLANKSLLGYANFFPNELPAEKLVYAQLLGQQFLYRMSAHFLSFFRINAVPTTERLIQEWFTFNEFKYAQNSDYAIVIKQYKKLQAQFPTQSFQILSVESLLKLFNWLRKQNSIPDQPARFDASLCLPLFKLYLLFNDDLIADFRVAGNSVANINDERQFQRRILATAFPQHDLINVDYAQLFHTQIYKAKRLLSFVEHHAEYQKVFQHFLQVMHCSTKDEYMDKLLPALVACLRNDKPEWTQLNVTENDLFEQGCTFLNELSVPLDSPDLIEQNDYVSLRTNPFHKIEKGKYRVIYDLFLLKKTYNGLVFKLSDLVNNGQQLFGRNFLGALRDDFSESILVYEQLYPHFPKPSVAIDGDAFKKAGLKAPPDFYARNEADVLLFESKDFFIRGEIKLSYDFTKIEPLLKARLGKATEQLSKNIERVLLNRMPGDDIATLQKITIFPVIVVHDSLYSAPALNYYVHYWMHDELEKVFTQMEEAAVEEYSIFPVTIIEIDTLILYSKAFEAGQMNLTELIKRYHAHVQFLITQFASAEDHEQHIYRSAVSFSEFVRRNYSLDKITLPDV